MLHAVWKDQYFDTFLLVKLKLRPKLYVLLNAPTWDTARSLLPETQSHLCAEVCEDLLDTRGTQVPVSSEVSPEAGMASPDLLCHWSTQRKSVPNDEAEGNGLNWSLWKWQRIKENWWVTNEQGNEPVQPRSQQANKWAAQNSELRSSRVFQPPCTRNALVSEPTLATGQEGCFLPTPRIPLAFRLLFKAYSFVKL